MIRPLVLSRALSFYNYSIVQQVTGEHIHNQGDVHPEGADPCRQAMTLTEFFKSFHTEVPQGHLEAHAEDVLKERGKNHHPCPSVTDV